MISDQFEKYPDTALGEFSSLMPTPSIVVADARIYRGTFMFALIEHNFIGTKQFLDIVDYSLVRPKDELERFDVYFLECSKPDKDCVGTERATVNKSIDRMVSAFFPGGSVVGDICY